MKTILSHIDPQIAELITCEATRQTEQINLIASENYAPQAVREALSSVLTNKYAEGYPGKRYYAGCEYIDHIEAIAIHRAQELFKCKDMHINVQPHAGSQANMAVYNAILKPGDTLMGMSLTAGGHLTHGHTANISGLLYNTVQYGVDPTTGQLDYNYIEDLAKKYKPTLLIAGASAYSRVIDFEKFATIAQQAGAYFMADIAHIAGLIVTGLHPSPVGYADFITSTTHKTLRGPRGGIIICKEPYKNTVDKAVMPGTQGGPFMHAIAAKAVAFKLDAEPSFKQYQQQVLDNAQVMAQTFSQIGYQIVSGGTDNHLFVLDLQPKSITGRTAETILAQHGITVSRSTIPNDPEKPWVTSGIRIGTPAITTRGCTTQQAVEIVHIIDNYLMQQHTANNSITRLDNIKKITQNWLPVT